MSKYANDDMFVPVMPRILDPSLKFTENSILDSLEKSRISFKEDSLKKKESHVIDIPKQATNEKKSVITVIAKYKIHIILLISIVLLVVIIYYVYKKYKTNKPDNILINTSTNIISEDNTNLKEKEKVDTNKISSYLSNYIDSSKDSDIEESDGEEERFEEVGKNKQVYGNAEVVERNNNENRSGNGNKEVFENIEVEEVEIIIPKNLSSIEELSEFAELDDYENDENISNADSDKAKVEEVEEREDEEEDDYENVNNESGEVDMLLEEAEPQDHNPIDVFNKYK